MAVASACTAIATTISSSNSALTNPYLTTRIASHYSTRGCSVRTPGQYSSRCLATLDDLLSWVGRGGSQGFWLAQDRSNCDVLAAREQTNIIGRSCRGLHKLVTRINLTCLHEILAQLCLVVTMLSADLVFLFVEITGQGLTKII